MLEEIIIALISWKTAILIVPWDTATTVFIHYASCGKVHIRLELCRIPNSPFPTVDLLEKLSRNSSSFKLGYTLHAQLYIYIYIHFFLATVLILFFFFLSLQNFWSKRSVTNFFDLFRAIQQTSNIRICARFRT